MRNQVNFDLTNIPLETRLRIVNEMMLQTYLVEIGVIPNGFWSDEKEKKYGKLFRTCSLDGNKRLRYFS
jgi:hypothetical protein